MKLPVATRQTFQYKNAILTDSNASLWLFSSVNHETFLEINFAKIHPKNVFGNFQAHNAVLSSENGTSFSPVKYYSGAFKNTPCQPRPHSLLVQNGGSERRAAKAAERLQESWSILSRDT